MKNKSIVNIEDLKNTYVQLGLLKNDKINQAEKRSKSVIKNRGKLNSLQVSESMADAYIWSNEATKLGEAQDIIRREIDKEENKKNLPLTIPTFSFDRWWDGFNKVKGR